MKIPKVWNFDDQQVAENFDSHVRGQLPWYDLVSRAVGLIGSHYITEGGLFTTSALPQEIWGVSSNPFYRRVVRI